MGVVQRKVTIDDVVDFITANAPPEGEAVTENPFKGRRFPYDVVDHAVEELHGDGRFLDLEAFDIPGTGSRAGGMWHTAEGITNYGLARKGTKKLLEVLQREQPGKMLEQILPDITLEHFKKTPINRYGTTLGGMIQLYDNSPYKALKDIFDNDKGFEQFRDFEPQDMKCAPINTWFNKNGTRNYSLLRRVTKQLIRTLQAQQPHKKLEEILPGITDEDFRTTQINRYGTTLRGVMDAHDDSPYHALRDLIDHDDEFAEFRDLQKQDMRKAPSNTWVSRKGRKNRRLAREMMKQFLRKLEEQQPGRAVEQILPGVTQERFYTTPINRYQTTLGGMLMRVYDGSLYSALKDFAKHDSDYSHLLPVIKRLRHWVE